MIEPFDYLESQADADELLSEFGQVGAIPRSTVVPGANPWDAPTTVTVFHRVTVAMLPLNLQTVGRDVEGTLIKASDQQALVSPIGLSIEPTTSDVLLVNGAFLGNRYEGGEPWTVLAVRPLAPAGMTVLYDMIVSR